MGGDYENTVQSKGKKSSEGQVTSPQAPKGKDVVEAPEVVPTDQVIRFHKSGNENHFHDDANKLKCAVPASEMFTIARNLAAMRSSIYFDQKHKTVLRIVPFIADGMADLSITVESVAIGKTLKSIQDFLASQGL